MNRILVCGGTGFVGSGIVKALIENHENVRVLTRNTDRISTEKKNSGVEYVEGNLFDPASLEKAMQGCQTLINAAQFENAPFENPSKGLTYEKVDAEGTEHIVEMAKRCGLARIVYISGAGVTEGKTEPWFRAKLRAEKAVRESGMKWTIFRPSWIYGPGDRSLNRMIQIIRFFPIVPILGKGYRIQPIFIDDVASIVASSLHQQNSFEQIYELGGPQAMTMKEIHQVVGEVLCKKRIYVIIPKSWAIFFFYILEKIPGLNLTRDALEFITMNVSISENQYKKVIKDFQVKPRTLKEAIQTYL